MIEKDIKPIYVFDGTPSYLKQETIDQRRQTREEDVYKRQILRASSVLAKSTIGLLK